MHDAQTWTAIIGMLTGMLAFLGLLLGLFERGIGHRFAAIDYRFGVVDSRFDVMEGRFDVMEGRFDAMEGRFDRLESKMDAGFERLGRRIDDVDRDVAALIRGRPEL
ncbi:MAG: hypothetical protein JWP74_806 [Marmoricola sp.]|nr:hypothetical protein [Marmoricola sp.]